MRRDRVVFLAFFLNLSFAGLEFVAGSLFASSALTADAFHDAVDALAIGLAAILERLAYRPADERFSLGYQRFSLLAAFITGLLLISGSSILFLQSIPKLLQPQPVNAKGMLLVGLGAIVVNLLASRLLDKQGSHSHSLLHLHFLEDTLGWGALIVVSFLLQWTNWLFLDPLLSLLISGFILFKALKQVWGILPIFLEASPKHLNRKEMEEALYRIPAILQIHSLQVWTLDGFHHQATMHLQLEQEAQASAVKEAVRQLFTHYGDFQLTIETSYEVKK